MSSHPELRASVRLTSLRTTELAWHLFQPARTLRGATLLLDVVKPAPTALAAVRSILRSNPRLEPMDALWLATLATQRAREAGIDPNFFCATLLQESAFDPTVLSSAGAIGIAQFTPDTAATYGVDPFDAPAAIAGSAQLLGRYVRRYAAAANPYALALAAYNAGPGAVAQYDGVPPYPETREYIDDITDRWARLVGLQGK